MPNNEQRQWPSKSWYLEQERFTGTTIKALENIDKENDRTSAEQEKIWKAIDGLRKSRDGKPKHNSGNGVKNKAHELILVWLIRIILAVAGTALIWFLTFGRNSFVQAVAKAIEQMGGEI